jgi:hypothetical protein
MEQGTHLGVLSRKPENSASKPLGGKHTATGHRVDAGEEILRFCAFTILMFSLINVFCIAKVAAPLYVLSVNA